MKTNKYLLLFHEWWGLNDYVKREAEKLQKDLGNVNVYAIDLYDGKVASTQDSAGKYMQGMSPERAASIVKGLISTLDKKAEIATIMRQLSRWYDVEIVYEGEIPKDRFSGNLPRDSKLSVILSALEQSQVHFRVEGKKIIVVP